MPIDRSKLLSDFYKEVGEIVDDNTINKLIESSLVLSDEQLVIDLHHQYDRPIKSHEELDSIIDRYKKKNNIPQGGGEKEVEVIGTGSQQVQVPQSEPLSKSGSEGNEAPTKNWWDTLIGTAANTYDSIVENVKLGAGVIGSEINKVREQQLKGELPSYEPLIPISDTTPEENLKNRENRNLEYIKEQYKKIAEADKRAKARNIIGSYTQVKDAQDLINYVTSSAVELAMQLPASIMTMGLSGVFQEIGGIYKEAVDKAVSRTGKSPEQVIKDGDADTGIAIGIGALLGALDYASDLVTFGTFKGVGAGLKKKLLKSIATDVPTEMVQTVGEEVGSSVASDTDVNIKSEEYINAGIKALIGSGTLVGGGSAINKVISKAREINEKNNSDDKAMAKAVDDNLTIIEQAAINKKADIENNVNAIEQERKSLETVEEVKKNSTGAEDIARNVNTKVESLVNERLGKDTVAVNKDAGNTTTKGGVDKIEGLASTPKTETEVGEQTKPAVPTQEAGKQAEEKPQEGSLKEEKKETAKAEGTVEDTEVKTQEYKPKDIETGINKFFEGDQINEEDIKKISDNWDNINKEPLVVWQDPKDQKLYTLSGQHTHLASTKLSEDGKDISIKAKEFIGNEQEAKAFSEANRIKNIENPLIDVSSNIRAIREEVEKGIDNSGKKNNVSNEKLLGLLNKYNPEAYYISYLHPGGDIMKELQTIDISNPKDDIKKIGVYIGRVISDNPKVFSISNEAEMYEFLKNKLENEGDIMGYEDFKGIIKRAMDKEGFTYDTPLDLALNTKYQAEGLKTTKDKTVKETNIKGKSKVQKEDIEVSGVINKDKADDADADNRNKQLQSKELEIDDSKERKEEKENVRESQFKISALEDGLVSNKIELDEKILYDTTTNEKNLDDAREMIKKEGVEVIHERIKNVNELSELNIKEAKTLATASILLQRAYEAEYEKAQNNNDSALMSYWANKQAELIISTTLLYSYAGQLVQTASLLNNIKNIDEVLISMAIQMTQNRLVTETGSSKLNQDIENEIKDYLMQIKGLRYIIEGKDTEIINKRKEIEELEKKLLEAESNLMKAVAEDRGATTTRKSSNYAKKSPSEKRQELEKLLKDKIANILEQSFTIKAVSETDGNPLRERGIMSLLVDWIKTYIDEGMDNSKEMIKRLVTDVREKFFKDNPIFKEEWVTSMEDELFLGAKKKRNYTEDEYNKIRERVRRQKYYKEKMLEAWKKANGELESIKREKINKIINKNKSNKKETINDIIQRHKDKKGVKVLIRKSKPFSVRLIEKIAMLNTAEELPSAIQTAYVETITGVKINSKVIQEIKGKGKIAKSKPFGSNARHIAINDMLNTISSNMPSTMIDAIRKQYYANILSSFTTHISNWWSGKKETYKNIVWALLDGSLRLGDVNTIMKQSRDEAYISYLNALEHGSPRELKLFTEKTRQMFNIDPFSTYLNHKNKIIRWAANMQASVFSVMTAVDVSNSTYTDNIGTARALFWKFKLMHPKKSDSEIRQMVRKEFINVDNSKIEAAKAQAISEGFVMRDNLKTPKMLDMHKTKIAINKMYLKKGMNPQTIEEVMYKTRVLEILRNTEAIKDAKTTASYITDKGLLKASTTRINPITGKEEKGISGVVIEMFDSWQKKSSELIEDKNVAKKIFGIWGEAMRLTILPFLRVAVNSVARKADYMPLISNIKMGAYAYENYYGTKKGLEFLKGSIGFADINNMTSREILEYNNMKYNMITGLLTYTSILAAMQALKPSGDDEEREKQPISLMVTGNQTGINKSLKKAMLDKYGRNKIIIFVKGKEIPIKLGYGNDFLSSTINMAQITSDILFDHKHIKATDDAEDESPVISYLASTIMSAGQDLFQSSFNLGSIRVLQMLEDLMNKDADYVDLIGNAANDLVQIPINIVGLQTNLIRTIESISDGEKVHQHWKDRLAANMPFFSGGYMRLTNKARPAIDIFGNEIKQVNAESTNPATQLVSDAYKFLDKDAEQEKVYRFCLSRECFPTMPNKNKKFWFYNKEEDTYEKKTIPEEIRYDVLKKAGESTMKYIIDNIEDLKGYQSTDELLGVINRVYNLNITEEIYNYDN